MKLRTYFWHHRVIQPWKIAVRNIVWRDGYKYFKVGNSGDILVRDIVRKCYDAEPINDADSGGRLLLIGSNSHRVMEGDVLCGIGTQGKARELPRRNNVTIYGLRGPLTYDEFKAKGYDMSKVRFLLDPGLFVRFMYNDPSILPASGSVAFIPHYRERRFYRNMPSSIKIIDIDDHPENVCRQILSAEHVFSSSLHGVVFSHALGRPVSLVEPRSESMLKYQDYYASVGLDLPKAIKDFDGKVFSGLKNSPDDIAFSKEDFFFPDAGELSDRGIIPQDLSR